ncbi:hypothetical protein AAMO2058_001757000 [Amorphochlora amoebiformis]
MALRIALEAAKRRVMAVRARFCTATTPNEPDAYNTGMKWLHWATAGGVIGCFASVTLAQQTKNKKEKGKYMQLHKSFGLLTAGFMVPRMALRLTSKMPAYLPGPMWQHYLASASHGIMYFFLVAMPVTGIAMGYYGGRGLPFFGYKIPGIAKEKRSKDTKKIAGNAYKIHKKLGPYFEYISALHVGATGYHALKGQAIFRRVNPFV